MISLRNKYYTFEEKHAPDTISEDLYRLEKYWGTQDFNHIVLFNTSIK